MTATEDIRDIHGPILLAIHHPLWVYLAATTGLLILAAGALAIYRRSRHRTVPPDIQTLRALEALRPLVDLGEALAFSVHVSDVVRRYVELAFAVRAPRRTTEELLADLMIDGSPVAAHRKELGSFLEHCDLAKYARSGLTASQMTELLSKAESFVKSTAAPVGANP